MFDLFSDRQRWLVFAYLENTDGGQASVSTLASYVSQHGWADDSLRNIEIRLQHSHLPKIAESGLLDYDRDVNTVHYNGHPLVEDCVDLIEIEHHAV